MGSVAAVTCQRCLSQLKCGRTVDVDRSALDACLPWRDEEGEELSTELLRYSAVPAGLLWPIALAAVVNAIKRQKASVFTVSTAECK